MDVLIINSYAGSITQACVDEGVEIRGSYEDAGYGLEVQKLNFPSIHYIPKMPWPADDLSNTIVMAHPPCAAFSAQNTSKNARGTDAKKFDCTKRVMEYALGYGCAALAIESVTPALEGAREVHDLYANHYGYNVFRILQNAATFGIPQWRPRFWLIFIKKDGGPEWMSFNHVPKTKSIAETMMEAAPGPVDGYIQARFDATVVKLKKLGFSDEYLEYLFNPEDDEGAGILARVIQKKLELVDWDMKEVANHYLVYGANPDRGEKGFVTGWLRLLNPNKYASTLLLDSNWISMGRPLSIAEYCAVMGFPRDYKLTPALKPGKSGFTKFREYLSRGVCPPVARWVLQMIKANIESWPEEMEPTHAIYPGEILDLTISRSAYKSDVPVKTSNEVYQ